MELFTAPITVKNQNEMFNIIKSKKERLNVIVFIFISNKLKSCISLKNYVNNIYTEYPDVLFLMIDVDNNPELTKEFKISYLPTIIYNKIYINKLHKIEELNKDYTINKFINKLKEIIKHEIGIKTATF